MPTLGRLRSSAFLRRSNAQPEEKFVHHREARFTLQQLGGLTLIRLGSNQPDQASKGIVVMTDRELEPIGREVALIVWGFGTVVSALPLLILWLVW
jgi:hypothetical protein